MRMLAGVQVEAELHQHLPGTEAAIEAAAAAGLGGSGKLIVKP